ncbi:nucleotidyltransferase [Amycolatopsis orientalis]|uniref:nucleotidyltransferase n=1 Tax=Amycolatopsis orientalis TaxID=31958 RepID=UPI000B019246|nr:nucleotidyltransferase [Amycolatopsis orientalis]
MAPGWSSKPQKRLTLEIQTYFRRFRDEISLGDPQVQRIESASTTLIAYLRDHYELTTSQVFLQGSYANGTAVKPVAGGEYDVDIVCVSSSEDDTAADALEDMYSTLESNGRYIGKLKPKQPCVRIEYADDNIGSFHVDVVPVRSSSASDAPLDAPRRNSGWHSTAPNEYTAWCAKQGQAFIDCVKMLKRWRDEHQEVRSAVKSIVLQVLVARHLPQWATNDAERIYRTLVSLNNELSSIATPPMVLNPVLESENLAARWEVKAFRNFKTELTEAITIARRAIEAPTIIEACEQWRALFGDAFPLAEKGGQFIVALSDTSHAQLPEARGWYEHLDPRYSASIEAWEYRGKRGKKSPYHSDGPLLFAGKQLQFKANYTGPTPVDIWWRVINTGQHARDESGLRGDFFRAKRRGDGNRQSPDPAENWESTSYTGTHLIEVFLLVGTRVVARSSSFKVNVFGSRFTWRP